MRQIEGPFFCYAACTLPHGRFEIPGLKGLGIDENTPVIFSSDNGADGPGTRTFDSTAGLRGIKRHLTEGGIRALFIARWLGKIKPGSENDQLTSHVDFLATAADLANSSAPKTDGISIVPVLLGNKAAPGKSTKDRHRSNKLCRSQIGKGLRRTARCDYTRSALSLEEYRSSFAVCISIVTEGSPCE